MKDQGKSICSCGHTGDGPGSEHEDQYYDKSVIAAGHGACEVCKCGKFTWVRWRKPAKERK